MVGRLGPSHGDTIFRGARFCRIVINPATTTTILAATTNGFYRSEDGGNNWIKMIGGIPSEYATDVAINSNALDTVYAAFWGQGIYKTTNASAAAPNWTKLSGGLPASGFARVALGISASSPQTLYALISGDYDNDPAKSYLINKFYVTTNGGATWSQILLPGGNIGGQGFYNINVAIDPTAPDIVYLSGVSLWKAVCNPATDVWTINDIGKDIHADNHALAFHPTNHLAIYAGNDGEIYSSADGGATWSDVINEGLCITQFEFTDQHPAYDAVIIGGTQDNGTEMYRNSQVFYHAKDGDGGFCAIDPSQPNNILSTYYYLSPMRSIDGGKFENWQDISQSIWGKSVCLFYPPMTLDQSNPNNAAIGGKELFLDAAQGMGGWSTSVTLPELLPDPQQGDVSVISAINYQDSNLIYIGTSLGPGILPSQERWRLDGIIDQRLPASFQVHMGSGDKAGRCKHPHRGHVRLRHSTRLAR
jgi:hypothetical protein